MAAVLVTLLVAITKMRVVRWLIRRNKRPMLGDVSMD